MYYLASPTQPAGGCRTRFGVGAIILSIIVKFESLATQQMQQLQQMRMLQSLGQYSQLGLSSFNSPFGQGYSNPVSGLDSVSQQTHTMNERLNDFQDHKSEYDHVPHGKIKKSKKIESEAKNAKD